VTQKPTSRILPKREVRPYDDAMKPSDALRAAVKKSGETRYRIAQETGMTESGLSRFVHGGGLNLASLDRLAAYLGLRLVAVAGSRKRASTSRQHNRKEG
jgi:transcriptional regulator with XRE-family HTH domain